MTLRAAPSPSPFWQPSTPSTCLLAILYKTVFLLGLIWLHVELTTPTHRAAACLTALAFVGIETTWTTISSEDSSGAVSIQHPAKWLSNIGHSSFAQFWSNVVFAPLIMHGYRSLLAGTTLPFRLARVALFPFNIWGLEIVEGYVIMMVFGRNVAWEYTGRDAWFHGNVKGDYWLPWLGLGAVVELLWEPVIERGIEEATRSGVAPYVLGVAAGVTAGVAPRMSMGAIWRAVRGEKVD